SILLESGSAGTVLDWALVQPELSKSATVCSYDRAGCGWSERGPRPRTCLDMVEELKLLLGAGGVRPPYLLVGWSLGGFMARLFASRFPEETAGVVIVDTPHEDLLDPPDAVADQEWMRSYRAAREKQRGFLSFLSRLARARLLFLLSPLL